MPSGNRMQVVGHFARVSLEAIARKIKAAPHRFHGVLGPREREASGRCVTLKRHTEFIGGRLAAKLAFSVAAKKYTGSCPSLSSLDIPPAEASAPRIYYQGIPVGNASISHSGRWAVGFFSFLGRVAVDVEDSIWSGRANQHYFSQVELPQICTEYDARVRWTLKECCFKLAKIPGFDLIQNAVTFCDGARNWVVTAGCPDALRGATLGIFQWGTLVVSVGLVEPVREA